MSRTYKDMPIWVLRKKRAQSWRFQTVKWEYFDYCFPPAHTNGAWRGVGEYANYWERKERARVRDELKKQNDPGGYKTLSRAKWDAW